MFSFFFRKQKQETRPLVADLHSHLIPGVDDGVHTSEESFAVINQLMSLGYTKFYTTPHIMSDYFTNTADSLEIAGQQFQSVLRASGYDISFSVAAEYYLDEKLTESVNRKEKLLVFGDRYFLFETNVISEPMQLKAFIFALTSQGIRPVLAHPERYQYMTIEKAQDLRDRGVLLQINLLSLIGYYGPPMQKLAEKLIGHGLVDALGSDCHTLEHAVLLEKVQRTRFYRKALDLPLLNYTL